MIKWVARLAVLTALLGLAGTIAIISYLHKKHPKKEELKKEKEAVIEKNEKVVAPITKSQTKQSNSITFPKPVVVEKKEAPAHKILPQKNVNQANVNSAVDEKKEDKKKSEEKIKEERKSINQNELKKEQDEKLFSQDELRELVTRINIVKEEHGIYTNCVQIYTTVQGNNKTAVAQVETFLRSKQFSIAGRETISKKVKGIMVTAVGECIRVTIGSF